MLIKRTLGAKYLLGAGLILSPIVGGFLFVHLGGPFSPAIWWLFAIFTYGIGDALSTGLSVQMKGVEEANPIARYVFGAEPGLREMLILKIAALPIFFIGYVFISDNPLRIFVPIGLSFAGLYATLSNLYFRFSGSSED